MSTAADQAQLQAQGLYDPSNEHDACGVGFVAHIKGQKSHAIVGQALKILENLDHRGAVGADALMGDGAGILIQLPDALYREEMAKQGVALPPLGAFLAFGQVITQGVVGQKPQAVGIPLRGKVLEVPKAQKARGHPGHDGRGFEGFAPNGLGRSHQAQGPCGGNAQAVYGVAAQILADAGAQHGPTIAAA